MFTFDHGHGEKGIRVTREQKVRLLSRVESDNGGRSWKGIDEGTQIRAMCVQKRQWNSTSFIDTNKEIRRYK